METSVLIDLEAADFKAVVAGVQLPGKADENEDIIEEDLDELEGLLKTLTIETVGRVVQKRQKLSPTFLIGAGKVDEIKELLEKHCAKLVIMDNELSGPQIRNIEKATGAQVFDRAAIILDIFARHAKTNAAKTQVQIAQLEYLMPRLTGAWTHFQRQTGGGVRARGMGEKQIEVDRRRAREKIAKLKKKLAQIEKERSLQRRSRQGELKVALVGYTNSGKTTVMKQMTSTTELGKDELFATLDSTVRTIDPNTRPKILLSDTVGFIRNLPTSLVESFKSTLEEVLEADLLVHVVDVSHEHYVKQMHTTENVLNEIGAGYIPTVLIFNKMDQVEDEAFLPRILRKKYPDSICVSAMERDDMVRLREHIYNFFLRDFVEAILEVPFDDQNAIAAVHSQCVILKTVVEKTGFGSYLVRAPKPVLDRWSQFVKEVATEGEGLQFELKTI